jgi:hypothetical protein
MFVILLWNSVKDAIKRHKKTYGQQYSCSLDDLLASKTPTKVSDFSLLMGKILHRMFENSEENSVNLSTSNLRSKDRSSLLQYSNSSVVVLIDNFDTITHINQELNQNVLNLGKVSTVCTSLVSIFLLLIFVMHF